MNRFLPLIPAAALVFAAACDRPTGPHNPLDGPQFSHNGTTNDDWDGGPLMGAIWNTDRYGETVDGTVIFDLKRDVYIKGGPPPNAPATAAGLNDGLYVFQVTPPNAKHLLSMDPARCRVVRVEDGQFVERVEPMHIPGLGATSNNWFDNGNGQNPPCHADTHEAERHNTEDKTGRPGAITVQLMPFLDTPNQGGVYKTSITPLAVYLDKGGDLNQTYGPGNGSLKIEKVRGQDMGYPADPGFGGARNNIKTDNFKVAEFQFTPPTITVIKFHDADMTGFDPGDFEEIFGWEVDYKDPLNTPFTNWTRFTIANADEGDWIFEEDKPAGTLHTATLLGSTIHNATALFDNGDPLDPVTVTVAGLHEETHVLIYGNVGLGELEVCKVYGNEDLDEIEGWRITVLRTHDAAGNSLANGLPLVDYTGEDGCVTFSDLLPGDYLVSEEFPNEDWFAVGPDEYRIRIISELDYDNGTPVLEGVAYYIEENGETGAPVGDDVTFVNLCVEEAQVAFGTKGYWHNKNGQDELRPYWNEGSLRAYVNGLEAGGQSVYDFSAGETGLQEISEFLVDNNSTYIQLQQQLLAFIFNTWIRVGNDGTAPIGSIKVGDDWVDITDIIQDALDALATGDHTTISEMAAYLDGFNNMSGQNDNWVIISVTSPVPCEFEYPNND